LVLVTQSLVWRWVDKQRRKKDKEEVKRKKATEKEEAKCKKATEKKSKELAKIQKEEANRAAEEEAAKRKEMRATPNAVKTARKQEAEAAKKAKEEKQAAEKGRRRREQEEKQASNELAKQERAKAMCKANETKRKDKFANARPAAAVATTTASTYSSSLFASTAAAAAAAAAAATAASTSTAGAATTTTATSNAVVSSTSLVAADKSAGDLLRVGSLTVYMTSVLGEGSSGTKVYKGKHADGRTVAVKVMQKDVVPEHRARREMELLQNLAESTGRGRDHVIQYRCIEEEGGETGRVLLGMELCACSLHDVVSVQRQRVPLSQQLRIVRELSQAVAFLHEHKIVHRDIRPKNILFKQGGYEGIVKLTDFGLSKAVNTTNLDER
jgi:hypothetical protein